MPEAPLERNEHGLVPKGDGWFVLNARRPVSGLRQPLDQVANPERVAVLDS
jgi:hypothetical protein